MVLTRERLLLVWRLAAAAALLVLVGFANIRPSAATTAPCDGSAPPLGAVVSCTTSAGATKNVTIPVTVGTTSVEVDLVGGGGGGSSGAVGGNGADVSGTIVLPVNTAYLQVLVDGAGAGSSSGPADGGGAAALFALDSGSALLAKLAIAGAGGGGGYSDTSDAIAGAGGDAGTDGGAATDLAANTVVDPGHNAVGATGGPAGAGGVPGADDSPAAVSAAAGAATTAGYGGGGGAGYGGGGGGGVAPFSAGTVGAGGGGGSSLISGYLSGSASIAAGSGGAAGAHGALASVSLTLRGLAAPSGLSATPGDTSAALSFAAPSDDGGAAITGYEVSTDNGTTWATLSTSGSTTVTGTVSGLTNGTAYDATVRAVNGNGPGPASSSVQVTPRTTPDAPTSLGAVAGNTSASLAFDAPSGDGGSSITGYEYTVDSGVHWAALTTSGSGPLSASITGLTNGTQYDVSVRAKNAAGGGASSSSVPVTPRSAPGAPTSFSATPGDGSTLLSFTAPASNGGSAITGYEASTDAGATWSALTLSGSGPLTTTVTGLTNGTQYLVRVHAVNAAGAGASSLLVTVTPRATPGVPTGLTATSGNASAQLSFVAPTSDGGSAVTGYDVSTDGGTTWSSLTASGTSTLTATVTGLTNGTQYSVQVRAKNAAGAGAATSGVQVTPLTVPGAPTSFSAIGGDGQLVLHFVAPAADGGTPITTYEASTDSGATWSAVTVSGTGTLTATVTGLTNGTQYLVRVHAVNAVGSGASSLLIQATPMTTPSVPGSFTAVRGNGSAALSFTAPSADGGSPVTGYQYSTDAGGTWSALTTSGTSPITATITGLTNGTQYDVQVRAVSAAGNGTATSSAQVTPRTVPGAPSSFSAIPGDGQITVQFTAPASDGGSSITGYDASTDGGATWSAVAVSGSGPLTATVTGLTNGTEYLVKVRATNLAGSGTTSLLVQVTPRTTPAAPSSISATPGNGSASLSFPAPSDGGATITGYQVSTDNGATWSSVGFTGSTTITVTVSGLTNGTQYDLALRASNAAGTGPASVAAQVTPRTVPAAPASLTLAPGNQQLGLQFTAPTDNGGAAISGYEVSTDSGATWTTLATTGTGTLAGTVTGLTNGTQYGVLVRAVNVAGSGSGSGLVPATPRTVPNAPTSLSLTPGNTQLALQFTVPSDNGGAAITGYEVSTDSGTTWASLLHSGTGPITAVLTGLGNGTQYGVEVRAVNLAGSGAASLVAQATPRTVPGAPGSVTLVPSSHQFALHFAAPSSDGGAAIGGYEVSSDGGTTWSPLTVSGSGTINGMVTGLVNGTQYSVRVRAVNVAGSGAASALVTVTPRDIPGPPSDLAATPQNGGGSLSFSAPSDNGGATITGYQVSSDNGATWSPLDTVGSAAISATVPGLKNGIQYSVSVRAVNDAGAGPQSVAADVTPRTVAVAPAGLVAVPGAGQLGLQFAAPIDDGGAAITGYEASTDGGATWSELTVSGSVPITAGLSGLQNSTRYRIAVRAVNVAGEGAASRVVTAATLPAALNAPQVRPGVASAELRWAPSSASYVTGYTVSAHPGPATCTTVGHDATSCVIGATSGTAYTYTVIAHSPFGDSAVSASSVAAVAKAPVRPGQAPASGAYRLGTTTGFISTLRPRQRITVLGSDLLPFGSVAILIYSQPRVLGSTTADANGNFRITVTIPADLETGKHTIVASSVDRDGTVRLLTLHGNYDPQVARPPMSGSSAGAQSLAFTGTPTFQLVAIGVVTMCAGVVMLQFGRGRARATSR